MSSDKYCCVPGCKDSGGMHRVLHGFPNPEKDLNRFNTWIYTIGSDLLVQKNEHVFKYRRVCHAHFEQKYMCRFHRLSNIAVPTLNIPGPSSGYSLKTILKPSTILNQPQAKQGQGTSSAETPVQTIASKDATKDVFGSNKENIATLTLPQIPDPTDISQIISAPLTLPQIPDPTDISQIISAPLTLPQIPDPTDISQIISAPLTLPQIPDPTDISQIVSAPLTLPQIPDPTDISTSIMHRKEPKMLEQKRIVKRSKKIKMSKIEKEMHQKIVTLRIKLCKIKNKSKKQSAQIRAAKKIVSNPIATKFFESSSSIAKTLINLQGRENKKEGKGRRFTLKEKIASLAILKQSPKGYRFLRHIFVLPAKQTLIKLIHSSNLKPGLNKNIMKQLQQKAETMKTTQKLCVVLFDEISLKTGINYNERKDKVMGVVDNGNERISDFADHAQVFMVRGLMHNYKQPIYYTFSRNATKGLELAKQLKEVVTGLQKAGFIVVATICDQGSNNRQALKIMLNETKGVYLRRNEIPKENIILINNQEIFPLYDPPHLLKGIRNNLLTKDAQYITNDGVKKTAKWSHLQLLLQENPGYKGIRLIPKLTDNHVIPEKMNKMKVKIATQVFSRTVASSMGYLADKGILPHETKETADFLIFMDTVFDSVNGSHGKNKNSKPLLGPATTTSIHQKTWQEAKRTFKSMIFLSPDGKKEIVPTVKNWVWTLNGIQLLLKKIKNEYGITSVWIRHLNQDPLENFFGSVRSHGCRNINPTSDQFESAFAALLINNLNSVHTRGKNCEEDFCKNLYDFIINNDTEPESSKTTVDFEKLLNIEMTSIEVKENDPRKIAPLQYISGYFLKKSKTKIFKSCPTCTSDLSSENEIEYIQYREYAGRRWLCTPSTKLIHLVSNLQDIVNEIIKTNLAVSNLKEVIKTTMFVLVDFEFISCENHKQKLINYLIGIVTRCLIHNYCKNINQILAGRRQADDDDDLQLKAKKYNKCFKRKK